MAGFGGNDADDGYIAGINVTPLVDVVLVLLIIFMMTAPAIYQSAIKVKLPAASSGENKETKSPLNFTITANGNIHWNDEKITWEGLGKRLAELGKNIGKETAMISADEGTPHGVVVKLMDTLRNAGLTRFALNVSTGS